VWDQPIFYIEHINGDGTAMVKFPLGNCLAQVINTLDQVSAQLKKNMDIAAQGYAAGALKRISEDTK